MVDYDNDVRKTFNDLPTPYVKSEGYTGMFKPGVEMHYRSKLEYYSELDSNEAVGKRLDFLMQEMNRETNTTASKSQIAEINIETVKMKDAIENIREQIRNIE